MSQGWCMSSGPFLRNSDENITSAVFILSVVLLRRKIPPETQETLGLLLRRKIFVPMSPIHSGHFYTAPSSLLLLRGAPNYSTDRPILYRSFTPKRTCRQLRVKD